MKNDDFSVGCFLSGVTATLISTAAWVTHVIVCIQTQAWALLLIGAIGAPIGVIHGIGIWFGFFR